jgi:hypothetical protein
MATALEKTLKRELRLGGSTYIVAISPTTLKITLKGKRKGVELAWDELVNGDAALATALNASVGKFAQAPIRDKPSAQKKQLKTKPKR